MRLNKKAFITAVVFLISGLFSARAMAEKKIGILLFSQEARYSEAKDGILDQLKKDGLGEPAVKYTIANAEGSKAKAAKVAQEFAEAKMDLIFTMGTNAAIAVMKEIADVPIVFTSVFDPVDVGIAKSLESSGNNTTGISSRIPMSNIMDCLKEFAQVKRLAVLYTPGEKQTEIQVKELQKAGSKIKVIPAPLSNKEEAVHILQAVVHSADAVYLTGSSIVVASASVIADMAVREKVLTITHIEELVDKGALMGIIPNSYLVGRLAGEKAVKILRGATPSSIPIEPEKKFAYIINKKTLKAGGFHLPSSIMNKITKTAE